MWVWLDPASDHRAAQGVHLYDGQNLAVAKEAWQEMLGPFAWGQPLAAGCQPLNLDQPLRKVSVVPIHFAQLREPLYIAGHPAIAEIADSVWMG